MIIGYALTAAYLVLLLALLGSAYLSRREIKSAFKGRINRYSIAVAIVVVVFFVAISLIYVSPVEQLYFDENIYQGIALNILHNGNALWCQYGGPYSVPCPVNQIYHDPVEWSFYLAIAFLIFGSGISTAYGLQLFTGALAIVFTFLLGSLLLGKRGGVASAVVFGLIPELFIWSRTQATPDLGLMMFTVLAFLCYMIYERAKNRYTLVMFLSALGIATYVRIEAILLIPIFIVVYLLGDGKINIAKKIRSAVYSKLNFTSLVLFAFFLCLVPQIYYIAYELGNLNYGSGTICNIPSNHTFSIANFQCNAPANIYYFLGQYNSTSFFPAYFSPLTTAIAIMGLIALLAVRRDNRRKVLLLLGLWILVYHLFYDFFYAGSVTYGVDVRFMLQIYPALAILGAAGIEGITDFAQYGAKRMMRAKKKEVLPVFSGAIFVILVGAFAIYPFIAAFTTLSIAPQSMPQEPGPSTATNFIYANYNSVPPSCLVFSFTPDIWYELNRSSAQIGYVGSTDPNFTVFASHYSCYVLDYGYWCSVPPYRGSQCKSDISNYNISSIVSEPAASGGSGNLTLYMINNYSN